MSFLAHRRAAVWLWALACWVAMLATPALARAHEDTPPPPSSQVLAQAGPAHIVVSTRVLELAPDEKGFKGTFEIQNTGVGTLSISRIWIPVVAEGQLIPPGAGVQLDQAGKSAMIAPGQKWTAVVTWTGIARARELYGHVLIASNAVDPVTKELVPPVAVGIHAEKTGGVFGWLGRHILSLLLLVPIAGALLLAAAHAASIRDGHRVRRIALGVVTVELLLAAWLFAFVDRGLSVADGHRGYQFIETAVLAPSLGVQYFVGVDGISAPFALLAAVLAWVAAWTASPERPRAAARAALLLIATSAMIGVFISLDLMLMLTAYLVLVVTLGAWVASAGSDAAMAAGLRLGGAGLVGGVLLLLAFLWLGIYGDATYLFDGTRSATTFAIPDLERVDWVGKRLRMGEVLALKPVVVALILGFGALMAVVPVHGWVSGVTTHAETGAAIVAVGVATKIGLFGLLRVGVGVVPQAMAWAAPGLAALGVVTLLYGASLALAARDLRQLVGYATTSQMGLALLGLAALTPQGLEGGIAIAIAHGLAAPLLLVLVASLDEQQKTTQIDRFGGLASAMPRWSTMMTVGLLASVGVPGLLGFWGDLLALFGALPRFRELVLVACVGLLVGAGAHLWILGRVLLGRLRGPSGDPKSGAGSELVDLSPKAGAVATALVALSLLLGLWPRPLLDAVDKRVLELHRRVDPPGQSQIAHRSDGTEPRAAMGAWLRG